MTFLTNLDFVRIITGIEKQERTLIILNFSLTGPRGKTVHPDSLHLTLNQDRLGLLVLLNLAIHFFTLRTFIDLWHRSETKSITWTICRIDYVFYWVETTFESFCMHKEHVCQGRDISTLEQRRRFRNFGSVEFLTLETFFRIFCKIDRRNVGSLSNFRWARSFLLSFRNGYVYLEWRSNVDWPETRAFNRFVKPVDADSECRAILKSWNPNGWIE